MSLASRVARRYVTKRAFMVNSLAMLLRYLQKPGWERAFEVVKKQDEEGDISTFFDWAREHYGGTAPDPVVQSVLDDPEKMYEVWFEDISPQVYEAYYRSYEWAPVSWYKAVGKLAPSWFVLSKPQIVKNQWLIHFTNNAEAIAGGGFKHGVSDLTRLGGALSNAIDAKRATGKFNFAYLLSESNFREGLKYGHEAVVIQGQRCLSLARRRSGNPSHLPRGHSSGHRADHPRVRRLVRGWDRQGGPTQSRRFLIPPGSH